MNQILFNKKQNNKRKYIFKVQLIISILIVIILIISIFINYSTEKRLEEMSQIINKNIKLSSIYETEKENNEKTYFGKIYINKIDLEYVVFNYYNDELLKIAPCKFYGGNLGDRGNICIAAHNYNDNRFFGRLDELEIKDEIILESIDGNIYKYVIFNIFETKEDDLSVLYSNKVYELTLLTCNNSNGKRIIVKAYMKGDWKKYSIVVKWLCNYLE